MKPTAIIFVALLGIAASTIAHAQRVRLDDSLSPRQNFPVNLNWQPQEVAAALSALFADDSAALPPVTGYIPNVEVRLNTSAYVNQRVRIYLGLPAVFVGDTSAGDIQLAWQSRGAFESGSVSPGQEVLIFEGEIDSPVTAGAFDFKLSMAGGGDLGPFNLEPIYELEVLN